MKLPEFVFFPCREFCCTETSALKIRRVPIPGGGRNEDFPDGPERGSTLVADLPTGTVSGGQPLRTGQSKTANRDERESDVRRVGAPPSC
jgi:hypothetical protein